MGVLKYDETLRFYIGCKVTPAQLSSLTAVAQSMELTVSDLIRASIDAWIEDIPERPILTATLRYISKPR